ncbi:MAG: enoyl-CoA hydratase/isomerase family protein [Chloroflexi bacterium]|nr:enoyl-CoA hydratase/isomerase family protein [Chloroflexota bacterium]
MSDLVLVQRRDDVAEVVLNRPDKRNAFNWSMMQALDAAITQAGNMSGVRAVILRGEGRGFSAGIDVMAFDEIVDAFGADWRRNMFPVTAAFQNIVTKFERCPHPVICLMHTYALGLALELALACDFRIVSEGTIIGLPETRLGIVPDVGGTTRLTRLVGPGRAKEFIITGKNIPLDAAERWGLVNYIVPKGGLMDKANELVAEIRLAAPLAVTYAKHVINGVSEVERGLQMEAWAQAQLMGSEDFEQGAQSMITKQTPQWKGK